MTDLYKLINRNDLHGLKTAIEEGADINVVGRNQRTLLHEAVIIKEIYGYSSEIIKLLIDHGANINVKDNSGETPLSFSIRECKHYDQAFFLLIENGADINIKHKDGFNLIENKLLNNYTCLDSSNDYMFTYLMKHGLKCREDHDGYIALHKAIRIRCFETTKLLLQDNHNVNSIDRQGYTPLHAALGSGLKYVRLILSYNPDISIKNNKGMTALDLAKKRGKTNIINLIENYRDNTKVPPKLEATPIDPQSPNSDKLKSLIDNKDDPMLSKIIDGYVSIVEAYYGAKK